MEVFMGCGCSGRREVKSVASNASILNTMSSNRRIVSSSAPTISVPANEIVSNPTVLDQDRLRIEKLRREATRRSLGR
jgi:hypothetical protein